jgi:hypothetical protein
MKFSSVYRRFKSYRRLEFNVQGFKIELQMLLMTETGEYQLTEWERFLENGLLGSMQGGEILKPQRTRSNAARKF